MEHPTGLAGGLQTNPRTLLGSGRCIGCGGILAVGRIQILNPHRERRNVRHRPSSLQLEFHGVGTVGQCVTFGGGEHETAHVQTQHRVRGWKVILAAMPSFTPDHLIQQDRPLIVVEDHPTGADALQHKVGGAFLRVNVDVQRRKHFLVLFEPSLNGQPVVGRAPLGFFVFHRHGGGGAQGKVIGSGDDGVTPAGHRAALSVNKAPPKPLEIEVLSCVDGTTVVEVDARCVPSAVVHHVACRIRRPPIRTACRRRVNDEIVSPKVADSHGRLNDLSSPVRISAIKSKREAEVAGAGFMPVRHVLHCSLARWRGQHECPLVVEVLCTEGDGGHQTDFPRRQGLSFILTGGKRSPIRADEVQRARLGRPLQGRGSCVSPTQEENFTLIGDLGALHADAFQKEGFRPRNGTLYVNRSACRGARGRMEHAHIVGPGGKVQFSGIDRERRLQGLIARSQS